MLETCSTNKSSLECFHQRENTMKLLDETDQNNAKQLKVETSEKNHHLQ